MILGDRAQCCEFAAAGIGEHHVDLRVPLLDRIVEPIDIGQIGHVAAHAGHPAADLLQRRVERFLAAAGDEHRCTLGRECLGGGEPDAAGAAGDHHDLVVEPVRHRLSPQAFGEAPLPPPNADGTMMRVDGKSGT